MNINKIIFLTEFVESSLDGAFNKKFNKKFDKLSDKEIKICIEETLKYLQLCALSPRSIFFPGDYYLDEIWHTFITETKFYEELCQNLGMKGIIHHTGVLYEDYKKEVSVQSLHEEQLSWLASYTCNFGNLSEEATKHLPLARALMSRLNLSLDELNKLGEALCSTSESLMSSENWSDLLCDLKSQTFELDKNPYAVRTAFSAIMSYLGKNSDLPGLCSNDQLRDLFYVSTSLGFTYRQHLAAMERLMERPEWQAKNLELWEDLRGGKKTIGLGTTHIGCKEPVLKGRPTTSGYQLNGAIPWISGIDIFDYFIIGFESENTNIFAMINYLDLVQSKNIKITKRELAALNGTSTASILVDGYEVTNAQVISITPYGTSSRSTDSRYKFPEIGIAIRALDEVDSLLSKKNNIPSQEIANSSQNLRNQIEDSKTANLDIDAQFRKDNIIRNCVRLLTLTERGNALNCLSLSNLLNLQMVLLDVTVQPDELILKKIRSLI